MDQVLNMHVIGEARPLSVTFADGRNATVTERASTRPSRAFGTNWCTLPNGRVSARRFILTEILSCEKTHGIVCTKIVMRQLTNFVIRLRQRTIAVKMRIGHSRVLSEKHAQ